MNQKFTILGIAATILLSAIQFPAVAQTSVATEIAPTGKLRFGINGANAALMTTMPDGKVAGVAFEAGKFIANAIGLPYDPIVYPTTAAFTQSFAKGEWDIILTGTSPLAAKSFFLSPDVIVNNYAYISAPGRDFADMSQVDRKGVKIGVGENTSAEQFLKSALKNAELVRTAGNLEGSIELLRNGEVDVMASTFDSGLYVASTSAQRL